MTSPRELIESLLEYAERFAEQNDEPANGGCRATLTKARAYLVNPPLRTAVDVDAICSRLLDSEEHATESAIPQIAEDAAEALRQLDSEVEMLRQASCDLDCQCAEARSLIGTLHSALDDASSVVDPGPDEEYAYASELASARSYLGIQEGPRRK